MHLYVIFRGLKDQIEKYTSGLSNTFLPFQVKGDKNPLTKQGFKPGTYPQVIGVREIKLYEFVFPRESKDLVLSSILGKAKGITQHKKHFKWVNWVKKILGVDPIDFEYNPKVLPVEIFGDHIERIGIGTKKDGDFEDGTERI